MNLRAVVACALLLGSGCGYALVGKGVTTDASIKKIGVPLFKDTTGKALDQKVTQKVIEELLRRGRFEVVPNATTVDAVVEGELLNYSAVPVGFTGGDDAGARSQAGRYAITLTARVRYTKVGAAEPIWSSESFSFRDEYDIGSDAGSFLDREEQSVERLTTQFARNLVAAMLEAF
ncbi:MAG: LptE family protein [Vicinamibacteria bacterium]